MTNYQDTTKTRHQYQYSSQEYWLLFLSWILIIGVWLFFPLQTHAQNTTYAFPTTIGTTKTTINLPFDTIQSIKSIDLGGDGTSELVVGSPAGFAPYVYLLRLDGSIINQWLAYDENFTGGVEVATGDIDADGTPEIITIPASGGRSHVRIFNGYGESIISPGFFASPETDTSGGLIDVIYIQGTPHILTLTTQNHTPTVSMWNRQGEETHTFSLPSMFDALYGLHRIDLGGDGNDEVIITGTSTINDHTIYLFRIDGSKVNSFGTEQSQGIEAYPIAKQNGTGEYIAITSRELKTYTIYTGYGEQIQATEKDEKNVGTTLAMITQQGNPIVLELPRAVQAIDTPGKIISIDLSEQRLSYFQDGIRVGTFITSTGKPGYETPLGTFEINNKAKRAYSNTYGLYMPYWMSFIGGLYGIHELPEWPNGYKEGEDHLGTAVSHGCVRLGIGSAETLYDWAEIGTPVMVQK